MEFELLPVPIAGFVGTVTMTAGMAMGASSSARSRAVVGIMAMPMMGAIHPRMQPVAEGFRLDTPGIMGVNYGKGTPLGLLMGHAVYGVVVALVYSALV